jgi:hypothetical protein
VLALAHHYRMFLSLWTNSPFHWSVLPEDGSVSSWHRVLSGKFNRETVLHMAPEQWVRTPSISVQIPLLLQEFLQKSVVHSSKLCLRASSHWFASESGLADVSSVVPELTVWSLLARLCSGEGAPSLFPVPAERGQGLPQPQPGK